MVVQMAVKNGDYELIVAPAAYPGKKYRGRYAYQHRVVYWQTHGTLPPVVHHENEQKRDNAPTNLKGKAWAEHAAEHTRKRMETVKRPDVELVCALCGIHFWRPHRIVQWKLHVGQKKFYCCAKHCGMAEGAARRKDMEHNAAGYRKGCRCDECRAGHATVLREYKRRVRRRNG